MNYDFQNQSFRQTQSAGSSPIASSTAQRTQDSMYIDLSDSSSTDPFLFSQDHRYPVPQPQPVSETTHSEKRRRILTTDNLPPQQPVQTYVAHEQFWPQLPVSSGTPVKNDETSTQLNNAPSFELLSIHSPHNATNLVRSLSSSAVPFRNPYTPLPTDRNVAVSPMDYSRLMMARHQHQAVYNQMNRQAPVAMLSSPAAIPTIVTTTPSPHTTVDDDDVILDEEMTNKNICLGMVKTDIVAIKSIELVRDEGYEAIQVLNEGRRDRTGNYSFVVSSRTPPKKFFGWLPFEDTKFLGPLADAGMIWWDAVIPRNKSNQHRTPVFIILYCQPANVKLISANLHQQNVYLEEPPFFNPSTRYNNPNPLSTNTSSSRSKYSYGGGAYDSANHGAVDQTKQDISELLDSIPSSFGRKRAVSQLSQSYRDENGTITILEDNEMPDVGDIEDDDEELDDSKRHIDGLKIALMKHQIHGVNWMIDREANKSSNGGILADMGLGKTIQTIGLILSTMNADNQPDTAQCVPQEQGSMRTNDAFTKKLTLIVTPLALIQQWASEIQSKTDDGKLRVLIHHGQSRTKDPKHFLQYDTVITTYQVVASDFPAIEKGRKKKSIAHDMDNDTQSEPSYQNTKKRRNDLNDFDDDPTSAVSSPGNSSAFEASILPVEYDSGLQSTSGYGPLFQTKWYRVVLDEAQQIKNRNTRSSLSCTSLVASKRWCLTGTPLQNNVEELYSLLRFLQIQPLANYSNFKKTITAQIQAGHSKTAMARLKAVLMAIMLRRTKSVLKEEQMNAVEEAAPSANQSRATTPGATGSEAMSPAASVESGQSNGKDSDGPLSTKLTLKLPDREKKDVFLDFSPKERELYEMLTKKTKNTVEKIFKSGKDEKNYLNMLCMLLRLRQACNHPQLVLKSMGADADALELETTSLKSINNSRREAKEAGEAFAKRALMAKMAVDLGWGGVAEPGMSVFDKNLPGKRSCELCSRTLFNSNSDETSPFCWECAEQVTKAAIPPPVSEEPPEIGKDVVAQRFVTSAKITKLMEILDETRNTAPTEKTIIFSQFTAMLDLIEEPLKKCGFKFCRYDGSMPNPLREKSLKALKHDPETTVMLISLKCGSLGLNLTAANRVILTDVWWNPALEEQAIDRVHRIGQTSPVHVVRLLVNHTIEQKVVALQQKKARIIHGALGDGAIQSTKLTTQEIRKLFDL